MANISGIEIKAIKKGYSAIIVVKYISLSSKPLPLEEVYYTNGTRESFEKIRNSAKVKSIAVVVKEYTEAKDFIIM